MHIRWGWVAVASYVLAMACAVASLLIAGSWLTVPVAILVAFVFFAVVAWYRGSSRGVEEGQRLTLAVAGVQVIVGIGWVTDDGADVVHVAFLVVVSALLLYGLVDLGRRERQRRRVSGAPASDADGSS